MTEALVGHITCAIFALFIVLHLPIGFYLNDRR